MEFLFLLLIIFFLIWFILKNFEIIALILLFMALSIPAIQDEPKWYRSFYKSFFIGSILAILYILILSRLVKQYQINLSDTMIYPVFISAIIIWAATFIIFGIKDNKKRTLQRLKEETAIKNVRVKQKTADTFDTSSTSDSKNFINKMVIGDREWLNFEKTNSLTHIPINTLLSVKFESIAKDIKRPVGSLVTINNKILSEHRELKRKKIVNRNRELRESINIPYYNNVKHRGFQSDKGVFHNFWNRTHTIPFIFSLDEGETPGITFAGTSYANGGDRFVNNNVEKIEMHEHDLIVNYLMESLLKKYKNNNADGTIESGLEVYLYNDFVKFNREDLKNKKVTFVNYQDENYDSFYNFQLSMNDYELFANKVIGYFKNDDFIYSTELFYSETEPLIADTIQIMLFNKSQNHIAFIANIANVES